MSAKMQSIWRVRRRDAGGKLHQVAFIQAPDSTVAKLAYMAAHFLAHPVISTLIADQLTVGVPDGWEDVIL